jgi:heme/copper-type cytochrome/quinol oxidase subunit 3
MMNKLLVKLFVWSEAMFFLFLIMTFVYYEYKSGFDAKAVDSLDFKSTLVFTILLIASSGTNWLAEKNFKKGKRTGLKIWMLITILLGIAFLFGEAKEYMHLFHEQITMSKSIFGMNYFTLTGFHGLHVFLGLVVLSITWGLILAGDFKDRSSTVINSVAIYWHFVDGVWIVVFTVVYILPHFT